MNHQTRAAGNLERRIHDAEGNLFAAVGADVEEFVLELARTGLRIRVLSHGCGPAVVLLHGVSESAAIWAPLFTKLPHRRLLAVDLPGHGLSDPTAFRRGQVREHAHRLIEDILDALDPCLVRRAVCMHVRASGKCGIDPGCHHRHHRSFTLSRHG